MWYHPAVSEETLVDLSDVLNTDPHILAMEHTGIFILFLLLTALLQLEVLTFS